MKIMLLWLRLRPQSFGLLSCNTEAKNFKVSTLYTVYFAQYRPKDRGRSRSRIIFPCWSQIKMTWVRLQLQFRLLSYAYLFFLPKQKSSVYMYFAQSKESGRSQGWSRIIFPFWSSITMICFRLHPQILWLSL
jgi:hypothetical protein